MVVLLLAALLSALPATAQESTQTPASSPAVAEEAAPVLAPPSAAAPAAPQQAPASATAQGGTEQAPAPSPAAPAASEELDLTAPSGVDGEPNPGPFAIDRASLPHDLSPWGMFMAADIVVKAAMIGLAFASLVTWTVWLAKSLELAGAMRNARKALEKIIASRGLGEASRAIGEGRSPVALMVRAAVQEARLSEETLDHAGGAGLKERVSSHLGRIEAQAGRRMTRGTGLLATIGSTAPFVGLFGTVWGIMNSFIGISESQTTNLAVVAPGIAEALLATALGLVAAIPAVVIYNHFARQVAGYKQALGDASAAVERLISRDLDYRRTPRRSAAQAAE